MSIAQSFLPEFDHETASTRRVLERLPEQHFDFTPHEKSMTLWDLASHVSELTGWPAAIMSSDVLDFLTAPKPERPRDANAMLALFDQYAASARQALESATDEMMMQQWTFKVGDHVIAKMPRIAAYRNIVMNHIIHHRGQLTVYYRMCDVAVPGLYGPSADER